jgi:hypothetical protein
MLPIHVALVADGSNIQMGELSEVAGALQKQVTRDFGPIWGIQADISAFPSLEHIPLDYWPIIIRDDIQANALGYHDDDHGQPFSLVRYDDDWTLTASHEALEMLGDPFGRRLVAGPSLQPGQGRVQYLVEVADPCEAQGFAYSINGVTVSDFYTPHYFDPVAAPGVRYSYNNSLSAPRQVAQGGYLSWFDPASRHWWQRTWFGGAAASNRDLGPLTANNGNLRQAIDRKTAQDRTLAMAAGKSLSAARQEGLAGGGSPAFANRAEALRAAVDRALKAAG